MARAVQADLLHADHDRITVAGPEITADQAAYAHGLALALPEKIELARPTGVDRAVAICQSARVFGPLAPGAHSEVTATIVAYWEGVAPGLVATFPKEGGTMAVPSSTSARALARARWPREAHAAAGARAWKLTRSQP